MYSRKVETIDEVCPFCGANLIKYYDEEEGWGRNTYEEVIECSNGC